MSFGDKFFRFRDRKETQKPFLDHLEDLRIMLVKSLVTLGVFMVLGFFFRAEIAQFMQAPLKNVDPKIGESLQSLGVADSFTISFDLAFYAGLALAFPFLIYYLADFILPGLNEKEKKALIPSALIGGGLFVGGAAFAYFGVLPQTLEFFFADAKAMGWAPTWTVRDYYSFSTQFIIGFGVAFELPVVVLVLVVVGVLSAAQLRHFRAYAVIVILIAAAVITPTTDVVTLLLMAVPMYVLYELSIFAAVFVERKKPDAFEVVAELTDSREESDK